VIYKARLIDFYLAKVFKVPSPSRFCEKRFLWTEMGGMNAGGCWGIGLENTLEKNEGERMTM